MARKDALLRLHEKLREKRDEIRKMLNQERELGVWREGRGREKASILTSILHSNQSINHSITTDTTRIKRSINRAKKL